MKPDNKRATVEKACPNWFYADHTFIDNRIKCALCPNFIIVRDRIVRVTFQGEFAHATCYMGGKR